MAELDLAYFGQRLVGWKAAFPFSLNPEGMSEHKRVPAAISISPPPAPDAGTPEKGMRSTRLLRFLLLILGRKYTYHSGHWGVS
jgi:hypothetical protein